MCNCDYDKKKLSEFDDIQNELKKLREKKKLCSKENNKQIFF